MCATNLKFKKTSNPNYLMKFVKIVFRLSSLDPFYSPSWKKQNKPSGTICDSSASVVFVGTATFPECSLQDVEMHIPSLAVFENEPHLGEKTGHLFDRLPTARTAHLELDIRFHAPRLLPIPTSPDYLTRWLQHARTDGGPLTGSRVCAGAAECSTIRFLAVLDWVSQWSSIYLAFKSSRWINIQPLLSENAWWIISWSALTCKIKSPAALVCVVCIKYFPSCFKSFGAEGDTKLYPRQKCHCVAFSASPYGALQYKLSLKTTRQSMLDLKYVKS